MLNKIGYVNSIDFEGLKEELKPLSNDDRRKKYGIDKLYQLEIQIKKLGLDTDFLLLSNFYNTAEECFNKNCEQLAVVKEDIKYKSRYNERCEVIFEADDFVGFFYSSNDGIVLPKKFVNIDYAKDYTSIESSEIKKMLNDKNNNSLAIISDNTTHKDLEDSLLEKEKELKAYEEKCKKELDYFRQKMYEKERALKKRQEELLSKYQEVLENLKDQIFMLELNIFALRSKLGETFSITHIRKGKNALREVPLIIYQKFRYMDEEITKARLNYSESLLGCDLIELFDKYYDEMSKLLCPAEKCMTFFKVSRSGKHFVHDKSKDIIEELEYYHGNQLGIIIKNGDNVYVAYIDPEIYLQDNLFISENTKETVVVAGETKLRDTEMKPMINRKLLFIMMQAIIDNSNIFEEFKNSNIMKHHRIIFSNADAQITSSKYPSFTACFDAKDEIKEGDEIFVSDIHNGSVTRRSDWGNGYIEEHRSRGYENRGRDAQIESGITRISIKELYDIRYLKQVKEESPYWISVNKDEYEQLLKDGGIVKKEEVYKYFVSCKRDIPEYLRRYTFGSRINNVNLEIYREEFMSIMWINSNYVKSWIDSADCTGGKDFVYFANNLKQLLCHLIEREKKEFTHINQYTQGFEYTPENIDKVLKERT